MKIKKHIESVTVYILQVFTDAHDKFGDRASIVIDEGRQISDVKRQAIARQLNTGETIFANNIDKAEISVMHPQGEISFAGVGILATAWFLSKLRGKSVKKLVGRDGNISVQEQGDLTWVRVDSTKLPSWNIQQLENAAAIEAIQLSDTSDMEHKLVWAWIDEKKGFIRARTFASDWDIPEAEGNGSGAMRLAHLLQKQIEITHGKGSVIFAKPAANNCVELGGRVMQKEQIMLEI